MRGRVRVRVRLVVWRCGGVRVWRCGGVEVCWCGGVAVCKVIGGHSDLGAHEQTILGDMRGMGGC